MFAVDSFLVMCSFEELGALLGIGPQKVKVSPKPGVTASQNSKFSQDARSIASGLTSKD